MIRAQPSHHVPHAPIQTLAQGVAGQILPAIYILAVTIFGARVFFFVSPDLARGCLTVQVACLLCYFGVAIYRQHFGVAAAFVAICAYIFAEHLLFSAATRNPSNFNALASYLPVLSFVVFCESRVAIRRLLEIFVLIAFGYLAIYTLAHGALFVANDAPGGSVLPGYGDRPSRLYLLAPWATFVAFYGLRATDSRWWLRVVLIGVACWALWLSGSRTIQLLFVLFAAFAVLGWTGRAVRTGIFVIFALVTVVMLAGLAVDRWNPYDYLAFDSSAAYRAIEYDRAIAAIGKYWVFGLGLPSDSFTLSQFLKAPRYQVLFASDLGPIGVLLMLGVPGLLMFVGAVYFCTIGSNSTFKAPAIGALQLNCLLCAAIGFLSPLILMETSTIFLSLLIAIWVRGARQRRAEAGRA